MYPGGSCRVLLGFSPPFSLILLNPEGNWCRIKKEIKFWLERLIINFAKVKPHTSDWDLNPVTPQMGLKPSQNSDWDLNPLSFH